MDISTLIAMVTEGLPADQAQAVRAAIERDNVKAKVTTLKAADEYQQLLTREAQLREELDGNEEAKKLGAREYKKWYEENFQKVVKLQEDFKKYEQKFGALEGGTPVNPQNPNPGVKQYTDDDIQRMVDKRIQEQYGPRWSELMVTQANILQKHLLNGRKTAVDIQALAKAAQEKFGGNLDAAYDEFDRPERERLATEAENKRVEQRVQEELQKRGATQHFTPAADMTNGAMAPRTKAETEKFDRTALARDLASDWIKAGGGQVS